MLGRSRSWFPRAGHIHTLSSSLQHMVRKKTLQAELCEQLTYHSMGEVDPHIHLTVLPKENQAKPEQEALDTPDVLNSDNPHFFIYKKFKEFSLFPRCCSPSPVATSTLPLVGTGSGTHYPAHHSLLKSTVSRTARAAFNWEIYDVLYGVRGSRKLTVPCAPCPRQTGSSASHGCKIKPVWDHPGVATLRLTADDK